MTEPIVSDGDRARVQAALNAAADLAIFRAGRGPRAGILAASPELERRVATAATAILTALAERDAELAAVRFQRDMARTELAELREHIGRQDERRRDAVAALCEALGLLPR